MDTNQLKNMLRVGRVSSVNGTNCTARVTFPDKEGLVSAELPVLQIGSLSTMGYWVPEVDTQVLCAFLPNPSGKGINTGFRRSLIRPCGASPFQTGAASDTATGP